MEPLPSLQDDGLETPVVGSWAEDKYQLVKCYASIFATSMKNKWECLVYVDLFSGSGRSKIADNGKIIPATPLLVLDVPYTKYIFCELEPAKLDALRQRVAATFPQRDVEFVEGDCNARVGDITSLIPLFSKTYRVLTFCFVDPYNLGSLSFATIEHLAVDRRIDFLALIASGMDANRNRDLYVQSNNTAVTSFLGSDVWRAEWPKPTTSFGEFIADQFGRSMRRMGYVYDGLADLQVIRSTDKNLPLYHLGVFSKHRLGAELWQKCRQSATPQRTFPGFG